VWEVEREGLGLCFVEPGSAPDIDDVRLSCEEEDEDEEK
jgi:hypothetical protein